VFVCLLGIDHFLLSHRVGLAVVEARGRVAGRCENMPWTLDVTLPPKRPPGLAPQTSPHNQVCNRPPKLVFGRPLSALRDCMGLHGTGWDWMSLTRTSCVNTMHYYPLTLPPLLQLFFLLFLPLLLPLSPQLGLPAASLFLSHHCAVACLSLSFLSCLPSRS